MCFRVSSKTLYFYVSFNVSNKLETTDEFCTAIVLLALYVSYFILHILYFILYLYFILHILYFILYLYYIFYIFYKNFCCTSLQILNFNCANVAPTSWPHVRSPLLITEPPIAQFYCQFS